MYQVIARKYRPQTFSELIGQEHVRTTLENAINSHRLAHGYIFSGQRGTGKTSVARILARCLNCVNGPTAQPCGTCSSCLEISASSSVDVIEIDAASNRGINEMRELRENVRYRPARDRYKVFIVDEAHQITNEAFNALLKTLEEPPEWVIFVLCTTESHKIPNTIASRCQQFSFRSVEFAELTRRMEWIAQEEGIETDADVLAVIAQAGEGSVRDSLSALDQAIACCGKTLKVEEIRTLLGMFAVESLRTVADAVLAQSGEQMLQIVQNLERNGHSLQHFCRELARYWRNLLVAKIAGKPTNLIGASEREQQALLETAAQFSEEDITRYLHLTLEMFKDLQSSLQPKLHLELGLIKLVQAGKLQSIEEALAGLGSAPATLPFSSPPASSPLRSEPPRSAATIARPPKADFNLSPRKTEPAPPPVAPPVPTPTAKASSGDLRADLYSALIEAAAAFTADAIEHAEVALEGNDLVIKAPKLYAMALKDPALQDVVATIVGKPVRIKIEVQDSVSTTGPALSSKAASPSLSEDEATLRALGHPEVKRFQELFPNSHVRTVRNLKD